MALSVFGGEYRVYTNNQGQSIEAKIISFDPVRGTIELERKDGQRFKVAPKLFSEDDQVYIRQWITVNRVLSEKSLRVSVKRKRLGSFKEGLTDSELNTDPRKGDIVCYEITFKNHSKTAIENLKIEYRAFIQFTDKVEDKESIKELQTQTASIARIEPGKSVTIKTVEIATEERYEREKVEDPRRAAEDVVRYNYNKLSEEELLGIWLKIYGPAIGDEPTVRELCEPDDLSEDYKWDGTFRE